MANYDFIARGIQPIGGDLPQIANMIYQRRMDEQQNQRRNELYALQEKQITQRMDLDKQGAETERAKEQARMIYGLVKGDIESGDPQRLERAYGLSFDLFNRISPDSPVDPRAQEAFKQNPHNLLDAMRMVLGIQEQAPAPTSERIGEFDVLMQGDKVIGHRGVRPEPVARVVVGGPGMGRPPSGYRFTAEGELEAIPGGPYDPSNRSAQAAASAQGRVAGTAQAEARADLPRAEANAQDMLNVLDQLEQSPGFKYLWGLASYATVPGTAQADAAAIWEQVQGKAFLEAFSTLKGGGQITEKEGEKATAAITRLSNRRQSPEGAKAAIADLRSVVKAAMARAQRKAGAEPSAPRVRRYNPETGKIE